MKKITSIVLSVLMIVSLATQAMAQDMKMYVRNQYVVRDVVDISGFDMIPIADIAGELGYVYEPFDSKSIIIYKDYTGYIFELGSPIVRDISANCYGLDVVPQIINGKFMIPAKFLQDVLKMSYVWDSVTNTIFVASEDTYNWLRSTPEYKAAASGRTTSSSTSSGKTTYPNNGNYYSGTGFPTFTYVTGIQYQSKIPADNQYIYDYGYVPLDIFYTYVAILQECGLTYTGTQEIDSIVFVSFWDSNDKLIVIEYTTYTGGLRIAV